MGLQEIVYRSKILPEILDSHREKRYREWLLMGEFKASHFFSGGLRDVCRHFCRN